MCCIEQSNSDRISLLQTFCGMLLYSFSFQTAAYLKVTEHKQRVACNNFLEQQVNHTIFTDNTLLTNVSQVVGYPDWFMVNLLIHSHPSSFFIMSSDYTTDLSDCQYSSPRGARQQVSL